MSDNNMKLWDAVCKTNPADTKKVNTRGGFTAICAQSQFREATRHFGVYGKGWGVTDESFEFVNGELCLYQATLAVGGNRTAISSSIEYCKNGRTDFDFAKKVTTDAITKALSRMGFNADVFLGKFDDNKYIQERLDEEFKGAALEILKSAIEANQKSIDVINLCIKEGNLSAAAEAWFELDEETKTNLWVAPSKGGPFSTQHRTIMQSSEFRESHFGVNQS